VAVTRWAGRRREAGNIDDGGAALAGGAVPGVAKVIRVQLLPLFAWLRLGSRQVIEFTRFTQFPLSCSSRCMIVPHDVSEGQPCDVLGPVTEQGNK
jgi:hypothetical protein